MLLGLGEFFYLNGQDFKGNDTVVLAARCSLSDESQMKLKTDVVVCSAIDVSRKRSVSTVIRSFPDEPANRHDVTF